MSNVLTAFNLAKSAVAELTADEGGAALIEYTVLLGILLVAVIAIIAAVGTWINSQWAALNTAI